MSVEDSVSRRAFLGRRGFLALAGTGSFIYLADPLKARAADSGIGSSAAQVRGAVERYLQSRAIASQPGNTTGIAGASSRVLGFERDRAAYMASLGQRFDWQGQIREFTSRIDTFELTHLDSGHASVRLYEVLGIRWLPNPRVISAEFAKQRESEPAKYGVGEGGRDVDSAAGVWHEVGLEAYSGGWTVVSDAYKEPTLFGSSPDAADSDFVAKVTAFDLRQSPVLEPAATSSIDAALAPPAHEYDFAAAVTYASNHYGGAGAGYNSNYVNYNSNGCGGDCANFVSQCFFKGNQLPDSHWYRYTGDQCGYSGRYRGSDTQWYNNWGLRNWVINQGRGTDKAGIGGVGKGDIINYDWDQNGSYQHVAMVSDGANNLVTAHNNDHWNFPWQLGDSSANHKFTNVATYYET